VQIKLSLVSFRFNYYANSFYWFLSFAFSSQHAQTGQYKKHSMTLMTFISKIKLFAISFGKYNIKLP
jgi:hypothetical protein